MSERMDPSQVNNVMGRDLRSNSKNKFPLYLLGIVALFGFLILTLKIVPDVPDSPFGSSFCLGLFLSVGIIIYFGVNWSFYNQIIVIEDQKSTIASFRRSSELV